MIPHPRHTVVASRALPLALDPPAALERLRGAESPWLLESVRAQPGTGRYSFVGANPYLVLSARGRRVRWEYRRAVHEGIPIGDLSRNQPTLEALRQSLPARPATAPDFPFCGGAVGVLGYELAEQLDVHRLHGVNDLDLPDACFLFVDALIAFDHDEQRAEICGLGFADDAETAKQRAERAAEHLSDLLVAGAPARPPARRAALSPSDATVDVTAYRKAVDRVAEEIAAGELYQACLTYRIDRPIGADAWQLYRTLRERDPAPFSAYLELPDVDVVSHSPERFLRIDADAQIESRPIKGTAARASDPVLDVAQRAALENSEKDRAENLMIVDLVRNDLGRVCEIGSVAVPELFAIEPYGAVFQLVSTVSGRLRADRDAFDAIAASFPPGSMTGAPKIAAMRLLDELEHYRRGFYSGALGYLDVRGGLDLSVVIRTAFLREGRAYLHAGGGLVADSVPDAEFEETRDKLRSLLDALSACENRSATV